MTIDWRFGDAAVDWDELSNLYLIAPLGKKDPKDLRVAFSNSMFKCYAYSNDRLIGVGRALADGVDCSYICDVAVHPDFQGIGLGKELVSKLYDMSRGHRKVILYAVPGKEQFYKTIGFKRMSTAMAIFRDQERALRTGLIDET
jgi:ribosomal protein S18 acetylase RimI-like enzyme